MTRKSPEYPILVCSKCNSSLSSVSFKKHFKTCDGTGIKHKQRVEKRKEKYPNGVAICEICNKQVKPLGLTSHIKLNHSDEKNLLSFSGCTPWNKGLTKETNSVIAAQSSLMKGRPSSNKGSIWSDEQCKAQSERKIALYKEFPEKHPNRKLAGNRKKMSYPERLAFDWLTDKGIIFQHNLGIKLLDGRTLYPDFVIGDLIIEIDGVRWHDSETDLDKDHAFNALGFTVIRIVAEENIHAALENLFESSVRAGGV